mgnify:CR=1 FL=1
MHLLHHFQFPSMLEYLVFPHKYSYILRRINSFNPLKYGTSRNFINGSVSYLSPYISRGVISTKFILNRLLDQNYNLEKIEKFIQELAWRDYWQQVWISKANLINADLKNSQFPVTNDSLSKAIFDAKTGVLAIDKSILKLYEIGYMHNHLRMYVASIACNIAQSHWMVPAKWMYYYLLDADWASNSLSWQWIAGTNSKKKYFANQQNINKYCFTNQTDTFLDVDYSEFQKFKIPEVLKQTCYLNLKTPLPEFSGITIENSLPTLLYNFYNLDPEWKKNIKANRILILEPSHFDEYPICQKSIDFALKIAKENIPSIQIYVGEFKDLIKKYSIKEVYYKEHPTNSHYIGIEESRDWMFEVNGYYPSFFSFWKKCKKQLNY